MENPRILLVSSPGPSRDSLHTVLPALMTYVALSDAGNFAQTFRVISKAQPHLVIIDTEIGYNESKRILDKLLALDCGIRIIILSEAIQWQRWKNNQLPCQVLLKGFSSQEFRSVIEISQKNINDE